MTITNLSDHRTKTTWSAESLDAEKRFGVRGARLYSLADKQVSTPRGVGLLQQAIDGQARVLLKSEEKRAARHKPNAQDKPGEGSAPKMDSFSVEDVTPYEGWMS